MVMKHIMLFALMAGSALSLAAQQLTQDRRTVDYGIRDSVDNTGNLYISYWGQLPSVLTFVNSGGSVTVCSSSGDVITIYGGDGSVTVTIPIEERKTTHIYEYDSSLKEQKTLQFQNEFDQLGAFTKDDEGNYYFFYAENTADKNKENMAVVKYGREGEKIKTYMLNSFALNSFDGVKIPFEAGTCRLEISGSMLAVYFGRKMFGGHQAAYGFVLDKNTFERIDKGYAYYYRDGTYPKDNNLLPFTGHSFNQFVLPIDNGFVFADHGDAYPRAFTFGKFQNGSETKRKNAFVFPGARGLNATYAEMGGLAKTPAGYIFAGAYGNGINAPRNLFVLTIDEELNKCSAPIYLTKYTKENGHAGHPKIAALDEGRFLLLWEVFRFSTQSANTIGSGTTGYLSTWMLVIDENGKALSEPRELKGIRLNMNDTLRYNPHNGKVYWAINDSSTSITVYALEIGNDHQSLFPGLPALSLYGNNEE
jgi:hypothetical protein